MIMTRTVISPRIIVFEGIDRAGKSILRKAFGEKTGERYVTLARFFFSNAVYDVFFGRDGGPGVYGYLMAVDELERDFGMLTIFVDTPPEVCAARIAREKQRDYSPEDLSVLRRQREIFLDLIGPTSEKRLILNTSRGKVGSYNTMIGKSVQELVTNVVDWMT